LDLESNIVDWTLQVIKLNVTNTVNAVDDNISLHKIAILTIVFQKFWLNEDWDTLRLSLNKIDAVNSIENIVLLLKIAILTIVFQKFWLDKNWDTLGFELNSSLVLWCSRGSLCSRWCVWSDSTLEDLKSHISGWSNHSGDGVDRFCSSNNVVVGGNRSNLAGDVS